MREDTFKINPNTGYLFPRNKENEKQPDLNGTFNIEDTIYHVAAWKKTSSKKGIDYYSFSFSVKDENGLFSKYIPIESNSDSLKDGSGYVIENRENMKTDKSPILSGQIKIQNILYSIRGWEKINKSGTPFYSCSIKNSENININPLDQIVEQMAVQQHSMSSFDNDLSNHNNDEDVLSMFESNVTTESNKSVFDNVKIDELIKQPTIRSDKEQEEIQNIFEKIESKNNNQSVFDNFTFEQSDSIKNSNHQNDNNNTNDDSEIDELMRLLESQ